MPRTVPLLAAALVFGATGCADGDMPATDPERDNVAALAAKDAQYNAFLYLAPTPPPRTPHKGELAGMTFAVKDNIAVRGMPFTFGSRLFEDVVAVRDASVVERLRDAGAIIVGKTNLDEFASSVWGVSGLSGQTRHAVAAGYSPGGSSAGSAVAVATGMVDAALGTDTCTSILMPAALAGVVGMRPSYGTVPLDGVLPGYPRQDVVGPIARSVDEVAAILAIISGAGRPPEMHAGSSDLTVLVPSLPANTRRAPDVDRTFLAIKQRLRAAGVGIVEGEEDFAPLVAQADDTQLDSEALDLMVAFLAELEGSPIRTRSDFLKPEIQRRILSGPMGPRDYLAETAAAVADEPARIAEHMRAKGALRSALHAEMERHSADLILLPTVEGLPAPVGSANDEDIPDDHCSLTAYSGLPAITLPAGRLERDNLPFGIMLMGPYAGDWPLLDRARAIEEILAD